MTVRYWIQAAPQEREAHVCWLAVGVRPVCPPQTRHLSAWHGPFADGDEADTALRSLYPGSHWRLSFSGDCADPDAS